MLDSELAELPLDKLFEFKLYHGEKISGFPKKKTDGWYITSPASIGAFETKILPSQIVGFNVYNSSATTSVLIPESITINGDPKFKTLIIVGAGASFDYSFDTRVKKPPLAKNLFSDEFESLIQQYPGVLNLSSQILHSDDIEHYFQTQWELVINSHNPSLLRNLIDVQFYLHALFQSYSGSIDYRKNNYISFFQSLQNVLIGKGASEKALIVSFNYDTILERSLTKAFNYEYNNLDDYVNLNRRFVIFKPHGSSNWMRKFNQPFLESLGIKQESPFQAINSLIYEKGLSLSDIYSNLAASPSVLPPNGAHYYYPHLLLPYKKKDSFVMPETHLMLLERFLPQVERVIILGWKGTEEEFKDLLKTSLQDKSLSILYANAKDKTVEKELRESLPMAYFSEVTPEEKSLGTFTELNNFIQKFPNKLFEHYYNDTR